MKIGLMLPIGDPATARSGEGWPPIRDMALAAEASGLDSVWSADHLIFRHRLVGRDEGIHEAWTMLSAVAAITVKTTPATRQGWRAQCEKVKPRTARNGSRRAGFEERDMKASGRRETGAKSR